MSENPTSPPKAETGHDVIARYLRTIDNSPGVYRMLSADGAVLYVGKARQLRKRVSAYAKPQGHTARILRMISETASMMFLSTETEAEALLLEHNLIKQLKPRYNVLLRDDKSFPNILVAKEHRFARIMKHRGARSIRGSYYGPFASTGAVNRTLHQLQRVFMLRNCSDATFEGRTLPCLLYQIKRCTGPCVGLISEQDYAALVADAESFLQGRSSRIQEELARQMEEASQALEFERAAALRDRIRALTEVQRVQGINPRSVPEADVIALHMEGGAALVQVFFIRGGQNWGNHAFSPRTGSGAEAPEVLRGFIGQFYARREPPRLILLSHEIEDPEAMQDALSKQAGRKVELRVPRRGEKAALIEGALRNAREALARRLSESATQKRLLEGLAGAFGLKAPPRRIEVYDNSHIQGSHAVGAMIVAGPDGFEKNQYRKYNIRPGDLTPGDDFAMMKQVLSRRLARLRREGAAPGSPTWPDLLLIDGGAGQVSAVREILAEAELEQIPVVGVAKGEDRDAGKEVFHRPGAAPMALGRSDPVLYFIQRLRDEAHRFAIGTHRARRQKAIGRNPLDDIPGIGPARKRALLARFGSAKAVAGAALADLQAVEGISETMARQIFDHFHEQG